MATQRPISTISYNTEAFLREKLETWYKSHLIQAYMYICHKGEEGDKDHIHVYIEPNKRLDAMALKEELKEYVLGEDKPRGVRPFRSSKEEDWTLYGVHDQEYLQYKYADDKCEKLPYKWQDIKASEDYDVETAYLRAKASFKHNASSFAKRLQEGEKASKLVFEGANPMIVNAVVKAMNTSEYEKLARECKRLEADNNTLTRQYNEIYNAVLERGYTLDRDENGVLVLVDDMIELEGFRNE